MASAGEGTIVAVRLFEENRDIGADWFCKPKGGEQEGADYR